MKASEDKNIEKLIDHLMKDSTLESPSFDFTSKVMSQVTATKMSNVTTYQPLISKQAFIAIFIGLTAVIAYVLLNSTAASNNGLMNLNYNILSNYNPVKSLRFSSITTYTVVLTTIMLCIQIPLLKNYYESKFNL
ncbi:MAG: hypothetical protein V4670_10560 [Bacteroidota bacterium]